MTSNSRFKVLVSAGSSFGTCRDNGIEGMAMAFLQRLQRKDTALEIVAVGLNGPCAEEAVLASLARGADRAVQVETAKVSPREASILLAGVANREKPDLVVLDHSPVDDPNSQIAPRLASILGWPYASGVLELEIAKGARRCQVVREIDGLRERLGLSSPAVLSIFVDVGEIPLLSLYEIVAARTKPIARIKRARLGKLPAAGITVLKSEPAVARRRSRLVGNVDELIEALREEAHVI